MRGVWGHPRRLDALLQGNVSKRCSLLATFPTQLVAHTVAENVMFCHAKRGQPGIGRGSGGHRNGGPKRIRWVCLAARRVCRAATYFVSEKPCFAAPDRAGQHWGNWGNSARFPLLPQLPRSCPGAVGAAICRLLPHIVACCPGEWLRAAHSDRWLQRCFGVIPYPGWPRAVAVPMRKRAGPVYLTVCLLANEPGVVHGAGLQPSTSDRAASRASTRAARSSSSMLSRPNFRMLVAALTREACGAVVSIAIFASALTAPAL